jgi:hypothetical protein
LKSRNKPRAAFCAAFIMIVRCGDCGGGIARSPGGPAYAFARST